MNTRTLIVDYNAYSKVNLAPIILDGEYNRINTDRYESESAEDALTGILLEDIDDTCGNIDIDTRFKITYTITPIKVTETA